MSVVCGGVCTFHEQRDKSASQVAHCCLHGDTNIPAALCPHIHCLQIELQRRLFAEARARSMNMDAQAEANVQAAMYQQQQIGAAITGAHASTTAAAAAAAATDDEAEDYD